jgi:disulfide bond formation protein DsbB
MSVAKPRQSGHLRAMPAILQRPWLLPALLAVAGLGAIAAALLAQYWGGLQPCVLCIYQRYAHGAAGAAGLLALAFLARPPACRLLTGLGAVALLVGAGIAAFHVGVEQHWWQGTAACHAPSFDPDMTIDELREAMLGTSFVACDEIAWELFGISMAGYNFLFSLALGVAVLWGLVRRRAGRAGLGEPA